MREIDLPYSGELLLTQLMAYGVLVALDRQGVAGSLAHDAESLTWDPVLALPDEMSDGDIAAAITETARELEGVIEADLVPGATGNDRRSVIWARGSFAGDEARAREPVARRAQLLDAAGSDGTLAAALTADLLTALGCPATWGGGTLRPAAGATLLDGVLGNHTSDLVRGVLRPARRAAEVPGEPLWAAPAAAGRQLDKTGWAPPGTPARLDHQWLAVLGMTLLPVAHRAHERSRTPAAWRAPTGRPSGVAVPLFEAPVSLARLRAVLASAALASVVPAALLGDGPFDVRTAATLRSWGVSELAAYERLDARGSGSSVAFSYRRGVRVAL